jgi:GntR family transcriptional regulator
MVNYSAHMVLPWATLDSGVDIPVNYCPPMVIDREWDEPVYQQVAGILRDQIRSGKIEPRRPIPSIRTLCETYGIARATAGKAIRLLADEGLIRRVPGKGWFVAPQSEWRASQ